MGIETLNSAAWAAGFAMAASEDAFDDAVRVKEEAADTDWRPREAVLVRPVEKSDRLKALFGFFHFSRRAPVSPA
ncbi:MAG: hypothetical protein J2P50_00350 [Hyphomicrobiaceae bacterium]|nr:hypothetical protein [Hyphomicrobiaceae bacterium]